MTVIYLLAAAAVVAYCVYFVYFALGACIDFVHNRIEELFGK